MRKQNAIRTAVAGLGRIGWGMHIPEIRSHKQFVLTDVIDTDDGRLKEAQDAYGCRTYKSWSKFLAESDAELVVVATPSKDHARQSIEALQAGKHVLVEKPMATRVSDADKMIAAAKKARRLLTVHQSSRLYPDFVHIQDIMRSGLLGKIFLIKHGTYGFKRRNDWQVLRKYGGGQLNNNGVHWVDQVCELLGSPIKDVFGDLQQILNPGDTEDHVKVLLRAENGMVADVEVTTACAIPQPAWVLMGDRGTLVSDGETSRLRYVETKKLPKMKPIDTPLAVGRKYSTEVLTFKEETVPSVGKKIPDFYASLAASIRDKKPLLVTPESARRTIFVLHKARKGTKFT